MYQPLKDVVLAEANSFHTYVLEREKQILRQANLPEGWVASKWWAMHHERFPKLAHAVKNLLCIPATSANCERAFSTLNDIVTKKRNRLEADTTEKLTFCNHNVMLIPDYKTNRKLSTSDIEGENMSDIDVWG